MLEVQWVTVFPHMEYTVLGLWKTSYHVPVFHFNFNWVGGERTSQKQSQTKVTTNFYSSKLRKVVKKRKKPYYF